MARPVDDLIRRLDPEYHSFFTIGERVQQAVPTLLDVANSAPEIEEQRLPPEFFEILVDQDPLESSRSRNLSVPHSAHEDISLPLWQAVACIKRDARGRDRRHPEDNRIAEALLRERRLPRAGIRSPETDKRPAVVRARHQDIDLIPAVGAHLNLPDSAGSGMHGHAQRVSMAHREDFGSRISAPDKRIVRRHRAGVGEPQDLATEAFCGLRVATAARGDVKHAVATERDRATTPTLTDENVSQARERTTIPDGA